MTSQIPDKIKFENEEYYFLSPKSEDIIDRTFFNFKKTICSTACYRGFWCEYELKDCLILSTLYTLPGIDFPTINNRQPELSEYPFLSSLNEKEYH